MGRRQCPAEQREHQSDCRKFETGEIAAKDEGGDEACAGGRGNCGDDCDCGCEHC